MRENDAPATLTASERASTVFAVPGRSSSSTCPPEMSAARTSRISSDFPWTTCSTFAASRPADSIAMASAESSVPDSVAGSTPVNDTRRRAPPATDSPRVRLEGRARMRGRALLTLLADGQVVELRHLHLHRADDAVVDPVAVDEGRLPAVGDEVDDQARADTLGRARRGGEPGAGDDAVARQMTLAADRRGDRDDVHAGRR